MLSFDDVKRISQRDLRAAIAFRARAAWVLIVSGPAKVGSGYRKHLWTRLDGMYRVTQGGEERYEGTDAAKAVRAYNRV
jgi:hypothetical protein